MPRSKTYKKNHIGYYHQDIYHKVKQEAARRLPMWSRANIEDMCRYVAKAKWKKERAKFLEKYPGDEYRKVVEAYDMVQQMLDDPMSIRSGNTGKEYNDITEVKYDQGKHQP